MVTSGFFNSINHDRRYDAEQVSSMFDGIILDGTFATYGKSLVVKSENDGKSEGQTVYVGDGKAWYRHVWVLNDSILPIDVGLADVLNDRIDAIVIEINTKEEVRAGSIKLIKGTPEQVPKKPVMENSERVLQVPLCYIKRPAGKDNVDQSLIENCIGTKENPFVTGLLQVISLDDLLGQWQAQLDNFISSKTALYEQFEAQMETQFSEAQADKETRFNTWFNQVVEQNTQFLEQSRIDLQNEKDIWAQWMQQAQNDFDIWFSNIKNSMSGDVVTNILQMIDDIQNQVNGKANKTLSFSCEFKPDLIPPTSWVQETETRVPERNLYSTVIDVPGMVQEGTAIINLNRNFSYLTWPELTYYMHMVGFETLPGQLKVYYDENNGPDNEVLEHGKGSVVPLKITVIF